MLSDLYSPAIPIAFDPRILQAIVVSGAKNTHPLFLVVLISVFTTGCLTSLRGDSGNACYMCLPNAKRENDLGHERSSSHCEIDNADTDLI
jgi:hypothetical protein